MPGQLCRGSEAAAKQPVGYSRLRSTQGWQPNFRADKLRGYDDLSLPIGVLYGRHDRILDPQEQGQALSDRLSIVELELIDGGHMLPITQPDTTIDFIRRQLQRQQAA